MKLVKFAFIGSVLLFTSNAFAECPDNLPTNALVDCIIASGAEETDEVVQIVNDWRRARMSASINQEKFTTAK